MAPSIQMLQKTMERRASYGEGLMNQGIDGSTQSTNITRSRQERRRNSASNLLFRGSWRKSGSFGQQLSNARANTLTKQPGRRSSDQTKSTQTKRSKQRLLQRSKLALEEETTCAADSKGSCNTNTLLLNSFNTAATEPCEFDDNSLSEPEELEQPDQLPSGKKAVRFRTDEEGEIAPEYSSAKPLKWFQEMDQTNLFITKDDFRSTVGDVRSYATLIATECPEIVRILCNMFERTGVADAPLSDTEAGVLLAWSSSHGRGLEDHLMVPMKRYRDQSRTRIIKFQEKMMSIGCVDYERALRERSCMESNKSIVFARLLAIGDALEAEKIHHGRVSREQL